MVDGGWKVLMKMENVYGLYEVNYVMWCKWFDVVVGDRRGIEEMLVLIGDDGVVRLWVVGMM